MRTTLDIDADVLQVAKEMAAKERRSAGAVLSDLARRGFQASRFPASPQGETRNGIRTLRSRGEQVTLSHVREILEEEGI